MDAKIALAEQAIGYDFQDKLLVAEALQMAGVGRLSVAGRNHVVEKNQRQAILGSTLLHALLCELWIGHRDERGNPLSKGDWSDIVQNLLTNEALGGTGRNLGLDRAINQSAGGCQVSVNMLAETVKALLAAVYLDAGVDGHAALREVVTRISLDDHPLFTTFHNTVAHAAP